MMAKTKGLIEAHIATVLISFSGLFAKLIQLSPQVTIFLRSLIAFFVLGIFLKLMKRKIKLENKKDYLVTIFMGVLMSIHWVTLFHAIQLSTVAIGIISLFTFPVLTAVLEPLFTREKLELNGVVSGLFVFIGVSLIIPSFDLSNNMTQGAMWGVFSALIYAIRNILSAKYVKKYPSDVVMAYQLAVVAATLSPFLFYWNGEITSTDIIYLIILGIFMTAVAHTLFIQSMAALSVQSSSIIISLQPMYSTFLAILFLSEIPTSKTLLGGVIIVTTVIHEMRRQALPLPNQAILTE